MATYSCQPGTFVELSKLFKVLGQDERHWGRQGEPGVVHGGVIARRGGGGKPASVVDRPLAGGFGAGQTRRAPVTGAPTAAPVEFGRSGWESTSLVGLGPGRRPPLATCNAGARSAGFARGQPKPVPASAADPGEGSSSQRSRGATYAKRWPKGRLVGLEPGCRCLARPCFVPGPRGLAEQRVAPHGRTGGLVLPATILEAGQAPRAKRAALTAWASVIAPGRYKPDPANLERRHE
jgi:hypothetical protein